MISLYSKCTMLFVKVLVRWNAVPQSTEALVPAVHLLLCEDLTLLICFGLCSWFIILKLI